MSTAAVLVVSSLVKIISAQDLAAVVAASNDNNKIFEPQVNLPALSAFLIIAIVFTLLQIRINSVR
jgi:hypothetical protein